MLYSSRTITFIAVMAGLDSLLAGMTYIEPIISVDTFAISMLVMGVVKAIGGTILRFKTTTSVGNK